MSRIVLPTLASLMLSIAVWVPLPASAETSERVPNVVVIVLDDLDLYDVGAFGSPDIHTPAMDSLARQGMRFTQFYSGGPVCSPSRAALLTGQHPSRFGIKRAVVKDSMRGIPGDVTTIAHVMKRAGYATAHIGKWHVGTNKPEFLPPAKGFDHSVRLEGKDYYEYDLVIDEQRTLEYRNRQHLTVELTDRAMAFVSSHREQAADVPFFLNLWYLAPHIPIQPPPDFDNSETSYCLSRDGRDDCDATRGDFAALVTHLDRQIQRLLELLERRGLADDTLVVLMSDNGGGRNVALRQGLPLRGYKGGLLDGGIRVPMVARWPGRVAAGSTNSSVVIGEDLLPTLAELVGADAAAYQTTGRSFLGLLKSNATVERKETLFWENKFSNAYFDNSSGIRNTYAVRDGRWKLLFQPATAPGHPDRIGLYDLENDPGERQNLLPNPASRSVDLLGYRLSLTELQRDPPQRVPTGLARELEGRYFSWRRTVGSLAYQAEASPRGVALTPRGYQFAGGFVAVPRDPRLDFHDGDFSFMTRIEPARLDGPATIAQKPGSWELQLTASGNLALDVLGERADSEVRLEAPLNREGPVHVAFTVFGLRDDDNIVALYVDGALVDQRAGDDSVGRVRSSDPGEGPMLFIGNSEAGTRPFYGLIEEPEMSVLALYPSEVFLRYSSP